MWLETRVTLADGKFIMSEGFKDAGRKIKAAVISSLMRDKGVDRTLKEMGDEDPGKFWSDLAEQLMRGMNAGVVEDLFRSKKESEEVIPKKGSDETIQ
jgi:hypothetical protein